MTPAKTVSACDTMPLSAAADAKLHALVAGVVRWNPAVNLVSRATLAQAWDRHVLDSLQLFDLAPAGARHWADLGAGGGFPGLVIAIVAQDRQPGLRVTLVEADRRKATFLREIARTLEVPVQVEAARIESLAPLSADVVSARALAPLAPLWAYAARHLVVGGVGLFLKGRSHEAERADAEARFAIGVETWPSLVEPGGVILRVRARGDD